MIIAGEASGDLHGANLVRELRILDSTLKLSGIGGSGMAGAGVTLFYDISNLAVMGIIEVFKRWKDIRSALNILEERFRNDPPDLLILIDYPGFNLELARRARKYRIRVLYYISPKIWAWREGRIERIKKYVDRMAVILPFEKKFYQARGVDVDFVGNPLLDQVHAALTPSEFRARYDIDQDAVVIGIMPGSREQEIAQLLPLFTQTAALLNRAVKNCVFLLPLAPTLKTDDLKEHIRPDGNHLKIRIIQDERYSAMAACNVAMAASGTLTMELAILKVPMVVCYRVSMITYLLIKPFIKVNYVSLVNLVAKNEVVPELLQNKATPDNIFEQIMLLLHNREARTAMQKKLTLVCRELGEPGASRRTAQIAFEMLTAGMVSHG